MPKYMKDARLKKPRNKNYEEREPRYKKRSNQKHTSKSDHKHFYEDCVIVEKLGQYNIIMLGKKCKHCGRIIKGRMIFTNEIPETHKDLPIITLEDKHGSS